MATSIENVEKKENEMLLSVEAHTVVNPWAVMIHLCYASLAD